MAPCRPQCDRHLGPGHATCSQPQQPDAEQRARCQSPKPMRHVRFLAQESRPIGRPEGASYRAQMGPDRCQTCLSSQSGHLPPRWRDRRGAERPPTVEVVESSKSVQSCARQWNGLPFLCGDPAGRRLPHPIVWGKGIRPVQRALSAVGCFTECESNSRTRVSMPPAQQ